MADILIVSRWSSTVVVKTVNLIHTKEMIIEFVGRNSD